MQIPDRAAAVTIAKKPALSEKTIHWLMEAGKESERSIEVGILPQAYNKRMMDSRASESLRRLSDVE